jgi:tetratricopeptide (TPR) repeat protein
MNRLDEALTAVHKAIVLDAMSSPAHTELGDVLRELRRPDEALTAYTAAITIDPNNVVARNNCAGQLYKLGRYEDAIAHYDMALSRRPVSDGATSALHFGRAIALVALGRIQDALTSLEAAATHPNDVNSLLLYGDILLRQGDTDGAVNTFEKAVHAYPQSALAYHNLGMSLSKAGRHEEAVRALEKALSIDPTSSWSDSNIKEGGNNAQGSRKPPLVAHPDGGKVSLDWQPLPPSSKNWPGRMR